MKKRRSTGKRFLLGLSKCVAFIGGTAGAVYLAGKGAQLAQAKLEPMITGEALGTLAMMVCVVGAFIIMGLVGSRM